jgi:transcriptional regulator with XRE-family HTH domain
MERDYKLVIIVRGLMKADALISSDEVLERELRDPEFRERWEKTALARWLAIEVSHHRAEHGLTQRALACLLGVNQSDVARMEAGEHNPTLDRLMRVASCLGIELTIDIRPSGAEAKPWRKRSGRTSAVSVGGAELVLATREASNRHTPARK